MPVVHEGRTARYADLEEKRDKDDFFLSFRVLGNSDGNVVFMLPNGEDDKALVLTLSDTKHLIDLLQSIIKET